MTEIGMLLKEAGGMLRDGKEKDWGDDIKEGE